MVRLSFVAMVIALTGCQPVPAQTSDLAHMPVKTEKVIEVDPQVATLEHFLALNTRLDSIAYGILKANTENCHEVDRQIGINVHTIFDYPAAIRKTAQATLSLSERSVIRNVVPGSAADNAGLMPGDEILSIGDYKMVTGRTATQFYAGVSRQAFLSSVTKFKVRRGTEDIVVDIVPEAVCGYRVQPFYAEFINAYTDGEDIWVTTGLMDAISSEEGLALIIAHELAHATQGHIFKEPTKALELEADRLSMKYVVAAGYDGTEVMEQWLLNPLNHKPNREESHPSTQERIEVLRGALQDALLSP